MHLLQMVRKKKTWSPKQGKWISTDMTAAFKAVTDSQLGIREAAKQYNIPRATLSRRLSKGRSSSLPASRPPVFTIDEENELTGHIKDMEKQGFGVRMKTVCKLAFELAESKQLPHSFNNVKQSAGYDWFQGFKERHPDFSVKKAEAKPHACDSKLNCHLDKLGEVMDHAGLKTSSAQIFNLDETTFSLALGNNPSIRQKTVQLPRTDRETVTVLSCASAQGHVLPPFIIFEGQRLHPSVTAKAPPGTLFGISKSGTIDSELFEIWLTQLFLPSLPLTRPILLIIDGFTSDISISTLKLAHENSIHMHCLPSLGNTVFRSLKSAYIQQCKKFIHDNPSRFIVKSNDFCSVFADVFLNVFTIGNITSSFKSMGIYPFNPIAVNQEQSSPEMDLGDDDEEASQRDVIVITMPINHSLC